MLGTPQSPLGLDICRGPEPGACAAREDGSLRAGRCGAMPRAGLIGADEPPPVSVMNGDRERPLLLLCDHAGNRVPRSLGTLGLPVEALQRHIAYDPGAAPLTRALSARFQATALFATYSRLLVDPNRGLDHPDLFWERTDGTLVPGNQGLTSGQKTQRLEAFYWPYHRRIAAEIERLSAGGSGPVVIGLHTFTPALKGGPARPWHIGVLWRRDHRIAKSLLQGLRRRDGLCVGDNQPYSGLEYLGGSMERHAIARGLPHVVIEVRNDLLTDADGVRRWAGLLGTVLEPVLAVLAGETGSAIAIAAE